jgi:hypothetical protein
VTDAVDARARPCPGSRTRFVPGPQTGSSVRHL